MMKQKDERPRVLRTWYEALRMAHYHDRTWRYDSDDRWFAGLAAELGELGDALYDRHEHPVKHELEQIASIALNWLDMLDERETGLS